MALDFKVKAAELRAGPGPELTSPDGLVDWVVVERVLAGHPVPMTWQEWDEVAGRTVALRLELYGARPPKSDDDEAATCPYKLAVRRLALVFEESETEMYARLDRWWEARRRRELRAEKEAMRGDST